MRPQVFAFLDFPSGGGGAPVLASIDYDQGDPLGGGDFIHLVGSGFTGATGVDFGGSASAYAVIDDNHITANLPAHAAGVVSLTVTGPGGTSNSLSFEYWDPSQLSTPPTSFARGPNYDGTPGAGDWVDEGSVGGSVNNYLQTNPGSTPSEATATLYPPVPDFDASVPQFLATGFGWTTYVGNDLFMWSLFYADTAAVPPVTYSGNLLGDGNNAEIGIDIGPGGVSATVLGNSPGFTYYSSPSVTCGTGGWHLAMLSVDSSDVGNEGKIAVDASGWTTFAVPSGYTAAGPGAPRLGLSYEARAFDGRQASVGIMSASALNSDVTKLRKWCNQYFGVSV